MYRPAGMSDDEEDDDGFSFGDDNDSFLKHVSVNEVETRNETCNVDDNARDLEKERLLENDVINAYITGKLEVIEEYHKHHDVNKNLHIGWTPLLYATSSVQPDVVNYLLKYGADPNKHKDGFTPLMALCNSQKSADEMSFKCLMLLIQAKADANVTSKRRETALMYACKWQNAEFVAELVKHIKNINICDSDGKSALMYASAANKPDIVRILLEHNADISLVDRHNTSAKDIAETKGFNEICALLTEDKEEVSNFCQVFHITTWKDLFPELYPRNKKMLDHDISIMLEGMGLRDYGILFQDMDLKTFLQLTEDDVCRLGIDITVHKDQFLEGLERFHNRKWNVNSLGLIKKSENYTIYDGILTLTNARKHIGVVASSFQYIKNNWIKATSENIQFSVEQRMNYERELRNVQSSLKHLKIELMQVKKLARKIEKKIDIGVPATFIGSKKSNFNWSIITVSVTVMIGLYFCHTAGVKKVWSIRYNSYF